MGGDNAPHIVVAGANIARQRYPDVRFLLFGDEARRSGRGSSQTTCWLAPISRCITPTEVSPATTSRRRCCAAAAPVPCGWRSTRSNGGTAPASSRPATPAPLMAMAKFVLKTLPGIDRPAIATFLSRPCGAKRVMLDLGANVACDARNLVPVRRHGRGVSRAPCWACTTRRRPAQHRLGRDQGPRDAEGGGRSSRDLDLPGEFHGFVEGDDIATGTVDVVVTDGFTGNIALKTAEGTAKLINGFVREAFRSSFWADRLCVRQARARTSCARTDPRRYNGAMFLGLNGIVVKSHGGTDALGFATAIGVAST